MNNNFKQNFAKDDEQRLSSSGFEFDPKKRSASFLQQDGQVLLSDSFSEAVDILDIDEAFAQYPEVKSYYGKLFAQNNKPYPADTQGGYFIRVKKGKTF